MPPRPALLLTLLLAACGAPPVTTGGAETTGGTETGWVALFDGETLDGWRGYNRDDVPAAWSVADGEIRFDPAAEDRGDLMVDGAYGDFELELEWQLDACGNSGVFYRGEEGPALDAPWRTALEYQLLDDACNPDGAYPSHRAGALYDLYVPADSVARPAQWNRTRIVADGPRIEHWLNGERVVTAEQGSPGWDVRVAASKFRDADAFPAYGTRRGGVVGIQDHGDALRVRSVRIRAL
ncbi:3-keto-disaccharide hydrolase [Rubrivirga litoralis]|uniref:DUF1080 domain-containing protein n=1 Tax=Rubrivirga litoralis TaxID=3075598 RepID=A0ABU3BLU2_9BACT|nr:DUF1080 domain-containing protein [Rubrivirga sp. F394]MDT0630259.1 DUF1080 domain-containing protein [Rubrivirga sp. F394]